MLGQTLFLNSFLSPDQIERFKVMCPSEGRSTFYRNADFQAVISDWSEPPPFLLLQSSGGLHSSSVPFFTGSWSCACLGRPEHPKPCRSWVFLLPEPSRAQPRWNLESSEQAGALLCPAVVP